MKKIGTAKVITKEQLNELLESTHREYEIEYSTGIEVDGLRYSMWKDNRDGKEYAVREYRTVYFGLNSIPQDKVDEFIAIVEREGGCCASWDCTGRTLHHALACDLQRMLPQYEFEVGYNYRCFAQKPQQEPAAAQEGGEQEAEDGSESETWQYYNPHPKGKSVGDCVKRSITKVTGWDYMDVQRKLNKIKREVGAKHFNSDKTLQTFIKEMGWQRTTFPAVKGKKRMSGESFCQQYPEGKFILQMAGHWTACVDGVIYDTWDCREKCVYSCYRVKEVE